MRVDTLTSPGILSNGFRLRTEAAKAISSIQTTAAVTPGGKTRAAGILSAAFTAWAATLTDYIDQTIVAFSAVTSAVVTGGITIKVTFPEAMDTSVIPALAAFANSAGTLTAVAWGTSTDAGKLILTGTGLAAAQNLTYTLPATNGLRDLAGNKMATGTKALT